MMQAFQKNMPLLEQKAMNQVVKARSHSGLIEVGVNLRKYITSIQINKDVFLAQQQDLQNLEKELVGLLNKALREAERRTNLELEQLAKNLKF